MPQLHLQFEPSLVQGDHQGLAEQPVELADPQPVADRGAVNLADMLQASAAQHRTPGGVKIIIE